MGIDFGKNITTGKHIFNYQEVYNKFSNSNNNETNLNYTIIYIQNKNHTSTILNEELMDWKQ